MQQNQGKGDLPVRDFLAPDPFRKVRWDWTMNYLPPLICLNKPIPLPDHIADRGNSVTSLPDSASSRSVNHLEKPSAKQILKTCGDEPIIQNVNHQKMRSETNNGAPKQFPNLPKNLYSLVNMNNSQTTSKPIDVVTITKESIKKSNVNQKVRNNKKAKQESLPQRVETKKPQDTSTSLNLSRQSLPKKVHSQSPSKISTGQKTQQKGVHKSVQDQTPRSSSTCQTKQNIPRGLISTSHKGQNLSEENNSHQKYPNIVVAQRNPHLREGNKTAPSLDHISSEKTTSGSSQMPAALLPKMLLELSGTLVNDYFETSAHQEEPSRYVQVPESASTNSSVLSVLSCSDCKEWVSWSGASLCNCRIICHSCKVTVDCELCKVAFQADSRFVNFHQRISSVISHPCRYHPYCNHTVKPGDPHEATCQFAPKPCFLCNIPVQNLKSHCESSHQRQVLMNNTNDVKCSDFIKAESSGKKIVFGLIQGIIIPIELELFRNEPVFTILDVDFKDIACTIFVNFEFLVKSYSFKDGRRLTNYDQSKPEPVKIPLDVLNDWHSGKSILQISFKLRNKRKISGNKKNPTKKRKLTVEEADGSSSNGDGYDDDSL